MVLGPAAAVRPRRSARSGPSGGALSQVRSGPYGGSLSQVREGSSGGALSQLGNTFAGGSLAALAPADAGGSLAAVRGSSRAAAREDVDGSLLTSAGDDMAAGALSAAGGAREGDGWLAKARAILQPGADAVHAALGRAALWPHLGDGSQALLTAFAAGTFLYVALCDLLPEVFHERRDGVVKAALLVAGVAVSHWMHQL